MRKPVAPPKPKELRYPQGTKCYLDKAGNKRHTYSYETNHIVVTSAKLKKICEKHPEATFDIGVAVLLEKYPKEQVKQARSKYKKALQQYKEKLKKISRRTKD